jgi:hypothetical protein
MNRHTVSRILFLHHLYQQVIDVHGIIVEFGLRWGRDLALFESFRGIYEPYNYSRKIVGFDTFAGFPSVTTQDGSDPAVAVGSYGVSNDYESYLDDVLAYHESECPISHMKKYDLVKGDVAVTIVDYLADHPETIIALAYFDLGLYDPTKKCLQAIKDHLTRGSIVGFNELCHPSFPGETLAFREELGLHHYRIHRIPADPIVSYIVID